jgi:glycosyltransferase involved in cell wall biosynthesis
MKPRILIVVDVPGWALDRTANNVITRLEDKYSFSKAYRENAEELVSKKDYDLLYVAYWRLFWDAGLAIDFPLPAVTGVRSHFKWDEGRGLSPSQKVVDCLKGFNALHVPSRILYEIFRYRHSSVFYTPHGVDESVFRPKKGGLSSSGKGKLVLGWAGSKHNHPGKRGIDDYILPAIEGLSGVSLECAAREEIWRTQDQMVTFYQGLDAYICASRTEGGPHPLLEAAACGVPLISTRVGIAPELITGYDNGILVDRTVADIRRAVMLLRDNPEMRIDMGKRARRTIEEEWIWDRQAPHYVPFFDCGLQGSG